MADPRVTRAEQRLAMLRELAELGMAMTRELTRRTLEREWAPFRDAQWGVTKKKTFWKDPNIPRLCDDPQN